MFFKAHKVARVALYGMLFFLCIENFNTCSSRNRTQIEKLNTSISVHTKDEFDSSLTLLNTIPLYGVTGRIDHMDIDTGAKRIFLCAIGNSSVEIIDYMNNKVVDAIRNIDEPQGVVFIPGTNVICISSGGTGNCYFYDASSYKLINQVKLSSDADNIRYDENSNLIFVGYGEGGIAVIDARNYNVIKEIILSGHPESFQLLPSERKIFVNIPKTRCIEIADIDKGETVDKWGINKAGSNFPMAICGRNKMLLVATRKPPELLAYDLSQGKLIQILDCDGDADDIFIDSLSNYAYVSCGEGYLDIYKLNTNKQLEPEGKIATHSGARTCLLASSQKKLFLAVPNYTGAAELLVYKIP